MGDRLVHRDSISVLPGVVFFCGRLAGKLVNIIFLIFSFVIVVRILSWYNLYKPESMPAL